MPIDAYPSNNPYKNFKASYNFEFSGMIIAKGELSGVFDNKTKTYKISFKGKTTPIINLFYKLNEYIEGKVNLKTKKDIYYKSTEKTSKKLKQVYINFKDKHTAQVSITKNGHKKTVVLKSNSVLYSPISLYLFFIENKFKLNTQYHRYVAVSSHLYEIEITPTKYSTINIDRLNRKTGIKEVVEVELKFYKIDKNGKAQKDKNVKKIIAWIAKDGLNIPIFVESWHLIGNFRARLTKLKYN